MATGVLQTFLFSGFGCFSVFIYDSKYTFQLGRLVFLHLISLRSPSLSGLERSIWHL